MAMSVLIIIASKKSVTKQASKKLTLILQLVENITRRYCDKVFLLTGIRRFWISKGTEEIREDIEKLNSQKRGRNIESFDFSTLYTKIPQEDLKEQLKAVTKRAFQGGSCNYIKVTHKYASWTNSKKDTYSYDDVCNLIDLVFDNAVFIFGKEIFKQIIGMVMGVDPAPPAANLYLYSYEGKYMEKLTRENYSKAKLYNHCHRFIDDLSAINNNGHLQENKSEIYHESLILNKENEGNTKTTYLDLNINIEDNKITTSTYDKRDAFTFTVINYPDITGNIPDRIGYNVIPSQIIRHARNCTLWKDAKNRIQQLIQNLQQKGYENKRILNSIRKCLQKHAWIEKKYKLKRHEFLTECTTF